ncbi:hypothetical protein BX661DRAFT_175509 [Kickxella alabastrina]|uniref:uncharacterized protein n=1 Tax=Kickxella alabastrina TaxID=61397 RepID=UPI00221F65BE|nr:uncharacterized protein BX661DRAFT_175509 [Kickxella alabastrina]KAI7834779.1 hypothetical protein BX661DRAFT_175509 [Kickxella alabastrina]KAJ1947481.1 Vacuolar protein-sorting-associated protein 27 [Kickxella alabastrina]
MVTRLLYGNPIEDEVNRLTAEDVPNHELDITGAIDFADKIRSKEYSAKEVARVLRKRMQYPNPNVQILVLSLSDICVKNGGQLVQLEISRREFIDDIANILETQTGRAFDLRKLVVKLIQEWALLFRGNVEMSYTNGVYERLKRSGYIFPELDAATSGAMIDTASAPEWEDSPVCQRCRTSFTFTNRKHHCRHCGKCFCKDCSSNTTTIPKFAIYDPVRVCHGCYLRLKKIVPDSESTPTGSTAARGGSQHRPHRSSISTPARPATTTPAVDDADEDLKRAIELSLQETQKQPNYADYTLKPVSSGYSAPAAISATTAPAPAVVSNASATRYPNITPSEPYPLVRAPSNNNQVEDEDPDLLAAIEASLRDIPGSGVPDYLAPSNTSYPSFSHTGHYASPPPAVKTGTSMTAFMPAAGADEDDDVNPLSAAERENVQIFESLLARLHESRQDISNDPQIQYLYETIGQIHPKITDAIDRVDQKTSEFNKLHDRIVTAIKIYDQLLDKRLRPASYGAQHAGMSTNVPSYMPTQQSMYPAVPAQQATFTPPAHPGHYQTPGSESAYGQQRAASPYYMQQPDQQPHAPTYQQYNHHQQQQQPQPQFQHQNQQPQPQQFVTTNSHPSAIPAQTYSGSPGYAPNLLYMPVSNVSAPSSIGAIQHEQHIQPQPIQAPLIGVSPVHQQNVAMSRSPPMNPHFVPPPVVHMPNIPVMQPSAAHQVSAPQMPPQSTLAPSHVQSPALVPAPALAPASVPEPEEVMLIEF